MENTGLYNDGSPNKDTGRRILKHVPMARPGTFADVAYAALFLAAPASEYVTGQTLCVDGGWTVGAYSYDSLLSAKTRNHPKHV
jgi:NAD(P)-dependent dehydrogenase (short-subunit alcohol dehydrogenase family)